MTSGNASKIFCQARKVTLARLAGTTDCSLKLCCGLHGLGYLGATCFLPLVTGTVSTRGTPVGAKKGFGNVGWNRDDIDLEQLLLDSTLIGVHQHGAGAKKRRALGHRSVAWWIDHQDSFSS